MSNLPSLSSAIESALVLGDLSKLNTEQRLSYYKQVCDSVGLNPLTKPFDYINLNGKLTLYAKRDATDQLRKVHKVSITISDRSKIEDVYVVTAKAKDKDGREDESTGAVNVAGLKGEALANAYMKAETKAKRRVTLSVCGLGLLDESEVADIPEVKEARKATQAEIPQVFDKDPIQKTEKELNGYVVKVGKFKGKTLADLDIYELNNYVSWLEKSAKDQGKEITGAYKEFYDNASLFLDANESRLTTPQAGA